MGGGGGPSNGGVASRCFCLIDYVSGRLDGQYIWIRRSIFAPYLHNNPGSFAGLYLFNSGALNLYKVSSGSCCSGGRRPTCTHRSEFDWPLLSLSCMLSGPEQLKPSDGQKLPKRRCSGSSLCTVVSVSICLRWKWRTGEGILDMMTRGI